MSFFAHFSVCPYISCSLFFGIREWLKRASFFFPSLTTFIVFFHVSLKGYNWTTIRNHSSKKEQNFYSFNPFFRLLIMTIKLRQIKGRPFGFTSRDNFLKENIRNPFSPASETVPKTSRDHKVPQQSSRKTSLF